MQKTSLAILILCILTSTPVCATQRKLSRLDEGMLVLASEDRFEEAIRLLNKGANINAQDEYGKTILHYAISLLNPEVVQDLIRESNIDLSIRDDKGRTPYALAEKERFVKIDWSQENRDILIDELEASMDIYDLLEKI